MHSIFIFSGTLVYLYISILLIMNILRYYYTKIEVNETYYK